MSLYDLKNDVAKGTSFDKHNNKNILMLAMNLILWITNPCINI